MFISGRKSLGTPSGPMYAFDYGELFRRQSSCWNELTFIPSKAFVATWRHEEAGMRVKGP